jgi:hypothetical protein
VFLISPVRWIATAKRIHLVIGISVLKKGGIGGLWDKVRHGQKTKKFSEFFSKILIVNMSASEPCIEKILMFEEMGYPIILKQLHYL